MTDHHSPPPATAQQQEHVELVTTLLERIIADAQAQQFQCERIIRAVVTIAAKLRELGVDVQLD